MFSRFFIDRPIFAAVISLFLVLAGLAAMRTLPVAQYPEIAPPVVTVQAVYPGASADVIEKTVAAPIENAINGVPNMIYMSSSSSSNGVVSILVTFEIGTRIDDAAVNVNNRVKQVEPRLPEEVRRQGVTVERGSSSFLQVLAFYAPDGRYDDLFTSNYVTLNVLDRLKRLPGTTNVQIFGAKDYAMRIWVKPDRLAQLKLTPSDLVRAVNEQNAQFAAGKIGQAPINKGQDLVYTITTQGRLADAQQFGQIIVRANPDGSTVRLSDVARIELGSRDYDFIGRINGKPATLVGIFLQPGANALQVAKSVRTTMTELEGAFPEGLVYSIPYDTTRFVEVSIREVMFTLGEAMVLVILVVFLFLQSWRATLIPLVAVPVSLLGAFSGLFVLGYSINTLTLFGMVLAIGIVVDDAIVVLENVERIMREEGSTPREAAIRAMHEVTGPIIAIVLTLTAVFIPIAFLGGLTGELYRQFAVTISIAVVISGLVALTLTPALCALILRPGEPPKRGFFALFNRGFGSVTTHYTSGVAWMVRRGAIGLLLFAGMVAIAIGLWRITPGSLVPDEDQGFYIAAVILPDGATLSRTDKVVAEVERAIRSNPNNQDIIAFTGFDFLGGGFRNNAATIFVTQIPWDERHVTAQQLVGELFGKTMGIKEALVLAFNPPPIFGLGTAGGYEFYIQQRGEGGPVRMNEIVQQFLQRVNSDKQLGFAQTLWRANVPQLYVDVDRDKAKKAGVPIDDIYAALSATLGSYYVNDFNKYGRAWQVLMSAEPSQRTRPDDVGARLRAFGEGRNDPAVRTCDRPLLVGARRARPLQQPAGGQDLRRGGEGLQLGPGDHARRADREGGAAPRLRLRLGRYLVPGKALRRRVDVRAGPRGRHGVPDPRRTVREVVAALLGAARAAVRHVWRAGRGLAPRAHQRRLLPDRPRDAARPCGQERDPDRRVRRVQVPRGDVGIRGDDRGGATPLPAHPDDLARLHPGRAAARDLHGRGRRRPPLDRHGRHGRDDRGDVPRDLLRADVLQAPHRPSPARAAQHRGALHRSPARARSGAPPAAADAGSPAASAWRPR